MKGKSELKNTIRTYLPPYYSKIIKAHSKYTGQSTSGLVADILKVWVNKISNQEKDRILNAAEISDN